MMSRNTTVLLTSSCAFVLGTVISSLTGGSSSDQIACVFAATAAYALGYYAGKKKDEPTKIESKTLSSKTETKTTTIILVILLAIVSGWATYYNSLPGIWIYDDWEAIVFNQDVTSIARSGNSTVQRLYAGVFSTEFWSHDFWGQPLTSIRSHKSWRPLTILTYRIQSATILDSNHLMFAPEDANWFRVVNVMLHGICTGVLAFWLCRSLRVSNTIALFASLFFAVHPVHTEVINCGVGRAEILSGIFFLLSLCAHARFSREHNRGIFLNRILEVLTFLFGFLAMISKETGITCLGVCAVQDVFLTYQSWCHENKDTAENFFMSFLKTPIDIIARIIRIVRSPMDFGTGYSWDQTLANLWRRIVAICFAVITCLTIRLHVMGWTTPGEVRAFSQFDNPLAHTEDRTSRVLTGWYLAARHMSLLFFPIQPLCHDWSLDSVPLVKTFSDSRNVGSVVLVIFLMLSIAYAVWMIATSPMVTKFYENEKQKILIIPIATASLLIPFLPASNLLFWVGFVVAERVMYLPSIGSCVLFGTFIYLVYIRFAKFRFVGLLLGVCLIIASLRHTISRNNAWRDSETLYKEDMEVNPLNAKIPYGLARVYINRDRFDEAEKALIRSLHIEPRFGVALLWLGRVYVQQFQKTDTEKNVETFSKGLHLLRKACENSPDEFDAHIFLADTLIRSDSIAQTSLHEATRTALRASEIRPHSSRPFLCLARIRLRLGDIQGAMEFLRPVVRSAIGEDENLLYHRDASKESIYLYATLYAYLGDMDRATEYYSIAATHGHEIAMTILSALRNGEVNEIRQEALDALNLWSRKLGNAFFDATFKTRRETEIYKYTGPADLYEHVNVFVTPEGECVLSKPLLEYYNRMQDTILRNCRRRVLRGQIGAMTSAQIVYESITKESMLKGTSISLKAKQDFGYWMDHRISYDISIDDRPVTLKFGLTEDPIAIARVTCVLYAPTIDEVQCANAVAQAVYEEQTREQKNRAEKNGGWSYV